ncbi:OmpH family outer membrane protein [Thioclava sp. FR2]|uniref:OmpH family outer membrane protein n=1 Tax=Thioclava sp. FR2 TaxID=3445780 RepID=UPI003EBF226D
MRAECRKRFGLASVAALAFAIFAGPATLTLAQTTEPTATEPVQQDGVLQLPFVTIDKDRLYAESEPGKAAQAAFDEDSAALIAENRRLEAALEQEERDLTARRASLPAAEFQKLAQEFDAKVEDLRTAQDTKSRNLTRRRDEDRQIFFERSIPVLGQLMVDLNAVAIIDRTAIILTYDQLDVTDLAIERLNADYAAQSDASEAPASGDDSAAPEAKPTAP